MYFYYLLCLFLCFLFILLEKYNTSKSKWHHFIIFILMIVVMVNASDKIGDLQNYKISFQRIGDYGISASTDIGFSILILFANIIGLRFFQFKCLVIVISLSLIYSTLIRYTNYASLFAFFYLLHSMFLDALQLRNFLSIAIVIFGLRFLIEENKSVLLYILCILLASTIHIMALVYLFFIWIKLNETIKKWTLRFLPILCILIIYISINTDLISVIILLCSDFAEEGTADKLLNYASSKSNLGFLAPTIIYFLYILFIKYLNRCVIKNAETTVKERKIKGLIYTNKYKTCDNEKLFKLIEQINVIGLLFLPFNIASLTFYRLVRNICLFDLIYFAICFDASKSMKSRLIIFIGVFLLIVLWRYFDFNMYLNMDFFKEVFFEQF